MPRDYGVSRMVRKFFFGFFLAVAMISPAICSDLAEDFLALNLEFRKLKNSDPAAESVMQSREALLSAKLFESQEALKHLTSRSGELEKGLLNRMVERLTFKVNHEKREDLREALEGFLKATNRINTGQKGTSGLDLNNGKWNTTPDGKKFWTSAENPEVILTPAEFQRVLISQDGQEK